MAIEGILSTLDSLAGSTANASGTHKLATAGGSGDIVGIGGSSGDGVDFGSTLNRLISAVDNSNAQANQATLGMVDGSVDVHDAMIALQRADMTFQLAMQIRNKLVNAYQEMMRMPV